MNPLNCIWAGFVFPFVDTDIVYVSIVGRHVHNRCYYADDSEESGSHLC